MEKEIIRLKEIMTFTGVSRDTLAKDLGVTPATISNISNGKVYPSIKFLLELSEYFDLDIRDFFHPTKPTVMNKHQVDELRTTLRKAMEIIGS